MMFVTGWMVQCIDIWSSSSFISIWQSGSSDPQHTVHVWESFSAFPTESRLWRHQRSDRWVCHSDDLLMCFSGTVQSHALLYSKTSLYHTDYLTYGRVFLFPYPPTWSPHSFSVVHVRVWMSCMTMSCCPVEDPSFSPRQLHMYPEQRFTTRDQTSTILHGLTR